MSGHTCGGGNFLDPPAISWGLYAPEGPNPNRQAARSDMRATAGQRCLQKLLWGKCTAYVINALSVDVSVMEVPKIHFRRITLPFWTNTLFYRVKNRRIHPK
jgi:hypothetical protein